MPKSMTVLVTGATGKQGGALARQLVERGHAVRALSRRPESAAARDLARRGVVVTPGDFEDPGSVERAARGCDAAFLMGTFWEKGVAGEAREGIAACDAMKRAGVKHVVYTSVAGAERSTGIPHFESKAEVERHLARLGTPWTVIAPTFFMENWTTAYAEGLRRGVVATPLSANRPLHQVAVEDVASFARLCIERPTEYLGKRIELAGDVLTGREVAKHLAEVTARAMTYQQIPMAQARAESEDLARMYAWFEKTGYGTDVAALRRMHPDAGWHDFRSWCRGQDWSAILGAGAPRDDRPSASTR